MTILLHPSINCLKWDIAIIQMEQHKALFYIFQLSGELSKDVSLHYHIGHLLGCSGEELILLLLYTRFSYKLSFYSILMAKYLLYVIFSFIFNTFTPAHASFKIRFILFPSVKSSQSSTNVMARPFLACLKTFRYS